MRRPNRVPCSSILPACAVILALASSTTAGSGDTAEADAKAQFLKFCHLAVAELSKDITPFEERHRNTEDPRTHHVPFQESPACVIFYTFEFYAAGLRYLEPGSSRRKTAESQINDALQWLATNQKGRGAKSSLDYLGKDTYMAGMPYLMHAFARQMPKHHDQALAAGQELNYITGLLLKDGPSVTRLSTWECLSWTMMSCAEKLMPGTILRASRTRGDKDRAAHSRTAGEG